MILFLEYISFNIRRIMKFIHKTLITLSSLALFNCFDGQSSGSSNNLVDQEVPTGIVDLTIKLGKVGSLSKSISDINLTDLIVEITAQDQDTILDTFAVSGNDEIIASLGSYELESFVDWTISVTTVDEQGETIHAGFTTVNLDFTQELAVQLDLYSNFSMTKLNLYPVPDSATAVEFLIDGGLVADTVFSVQTIVGDTVTLEYDYLFTNDTSAVQVNVRGIMWGVDTLLYTGDLVLSIPSGVDTTFILPLSWVGPDVPTGMAALTVVIGNVGTATINAEVPISSSSEEPSSSSEEESSSSTIVIDLVEVWDSYQQNATYNSGRRGFDIQGNYLYMVGGDGYGKLHVFDISNPEVPAHLATLDETHQIGWYPGDINVNGDYAYITNGKIIDISTPSSPVATAIELDGHGDNFEVHIEGDDLYTIDQSDGINIYDISTTPENPNFLNSVTGYNYPYGFTVSGGYVYQCGVSGDGFSILDFNSPTPAQVSSLSGECYDVYVISNTAYVLHYTGSRIVDISNPLVPSQVATFDGAQESGVDVSVDGLYMALGRDYGGVSIYDLSSPLSPVFIDNESYTGEPNGNRRAYKTMFHGDYLFTAFEDYGVRIYKYKH